jgi:ATP-dependent exoDNAse (exonuclease V) beta subunit
MSNPVPDFLALKNTHPRDEFISFDEGPHIYTVHGDSSFTSVTTWNHSHFEHFDSDGIIDKILTNKRRNDPTYKYYGKTKEQIKADWDKNRDEAAAAGTKMHYDIECYYNEMDVNNDSIEYSWFLRFVKDFPELKPYRTEWCVYYEELKLSGSIDMIFENPDGTLQIYDWKRCKEISYDSYYGKSAITPCIKHLPDTNYWHYSLQLNVYKNILEIKYGKKVTALYLVCLHPDSGYKTYDRIEVQILDKEIKDLFEFRKTQLEQI